MTTQVVQIVVESVVKEAAKEVGELAVKEGAKQLTKESLKQTGKIAVINVTTFGGKLAIISLEKNGLEAIKQLAKQGAEAAPQTLGKQLVKDSVVNGGGKAAAKHILPKAAEAGTKAISYGMKICLVIEASFIGLQTAWDVTQYVSGSKSGNEVVKNVANNTVQGVGAFIGGIIGEAVIPIPIMGPLIGSAIGTILVNTSLPSNNGQTEDSPIYNNIPPN